MIGTQPTGAIAGAVISFVSFEGLSVTVDGKPGRLAILRDDGSIYCAGSTVAQEVQSVVVNAHRAMLQGKGYMRVYSDHNVIMEHYAPGAWKV